MTKLTSDPDGSAEGAAPMRDGGKRAFLVTLHDAGTDGRAPFVAVQASHSNRAHRFTDLASAFRYLERLDRPSDDDRNEDATDDEP